MTTVIMDELREVTVTDNGPSTSVTVSPMGMQGPQGNPTTVNGHTGASITLTASDVGAVPTAEVGVANGVASLDSGGLVPMGQLNLTSLAGDFMDLSTNQTLTTGIKTFGVSPIVPDTPSGSHAAVNQSYVLSEIALALPLTGGTLTGPLTATALTSPSLTGSTASGGTLTIASTSNATKGKILFGNSAYDEVNNRLGIRNTTPLVAVHVSGAASTLMFRIDNTGDSVGRFTIDSGGAHAWGPGGSGATDTTLSRNGVGGLVTNAQIVMNGSNASGLLLIQNQQATTTDPGTISIEETASTNGGLGIYVSGDTDPRWTLRADGMLQWGPGGSTNTDTNLYRSAVATLKTDDNFVIAGTLSVTGVTTINNQVAINRTTDSSAINATYTVTANATNSAFAYTGTTNAGRLMSATVSGDTTGRYMVDINGTHNWGSGTATRDTFLGRAGAGVAYVSPTLVVGATATLGDNMSGGIALHDTTTAPTSNPTGGVLIYSQSSTGNALKVRLPGGAVFGLTPAIAVLAADSAAMTTTTQTSSGLALAVEAGATYLMEMTVFIKSTVATGNTLAHTFTGPSGATMQWGDTNTTSDYAATLTTVKSGDVGLDASTHCLVLVGYLTISSTAGTLTWTVACSATASSPSFKVGAGSSMQLTRIN